MFRVCHAIDVTPYELAKELGVDFKEIAVRCGDKRKPVDMDGDDVWWLLLEALEERLGNLLAVKADLDRLLQKDRTRRAARIERVRALPLPPQAD